MSTVQARLTRKFKLKHALSEWKAFQLTNQVAEGAFNKLLELNHRHSKARFETASRLLTKVARRVHGVQLVQALLQNAGFPLSKRAATLSPSLRRRMFSQPLSKESSAQ